MKRKCKNSYRIAAVAAFSALLLTACSGKGSAAPSEPVPQVVSQTVSQTVVLPFGSEVPADGSGAVILPFGSDVPADGSGPVVLPYGSTLQEASDATGDTGAEGESLQFSGSDGDRQYLMNAEERYYYNQYLESISNIPSVVIFTENNAPIMTKSTYVPCVVDIINADDGSTLSNATAGIRLRGNSSAYYEDPEQVLANPVPYRIKFDKKTSVLGLNNGAECKSWVLLYGSWDFARPDIMMHLGRALMRGNQFCSDSKLVKVYVNSEYKGIYVLCEQNQVNKNRVNIYECPEGYTGTDIGYYVELDNYAEDPCFETNYCSNAVVTDIHGVQRSVVSSLYSVKNDLYSDEQTEYISKYINNVYNIVYNACEKGIYYSLDENHDMVPSNFTNAKDTVEAVLDVDNAVDMYILHELLMSQDCGEGSFFMCVDFSKESNIKKLTFTTIWDFNWTSGWEADSDFFAGTFRDDETVNAFGDRSNPWLILLLNQDWFRKMASERISSLLKDGTIDACLNAERKYLEKYEADLSTDDDWRYGFNYSLNDFFKDRINWLNKALGNFS